MDDLDIHVMEQRKDTAIIRLSGSLAPSGEARLDGITSALYERGCRKMIFSCERLLYVSSAGLKVLLKLTHKLGFRSGLVLCGINRDITGILELSGLIRCVLTCDDVSQARQRYLGAGTG